MSAKRDNGIIIVSLFFVFLSYQSPLLFGKDFSGSLSSDYLTQNNNRAFKNNAPIQTMPAPAPVDPAFPQASTNEPIQNQPVINEAPIISTPQTQSPLIQPAPITKSTIGVSSQNAPLPASTSQMPTSLKSPYDLKQPRISVPNYEKKFQAMLLAQQLAKAKKRQNLFESILEEAMNYSVIIVLGLVALVVIYALRKDQKTTPPPPQQQKTEEPKKDIWHEDF